MKWISMMKYSSQGAGSLRQSGGTGRRDTVAEALGANGVTLLHWWHGATPEWDVFMVTESDQPAAVQARFINDTFASGDMDHAATIPLVDAEEFDAVEVVPHPSSQH